jgi:saccharopepsin
MFSFIVLLIFQLTVMVPESESVYTVPISRGRRPTNNQVSRLNKNINQTQSNSTKSPGSKSANLVNIGNYYYTATVMIGSGQPFKVDLDTGSADFWLRGPNCTSIDGSCGEHADESKQLAVDLKDIAVIPTSKNFSKLYGSSAVSGSVYKTTVAMAGVNVTMNIGVSNLERGYSSLNADGLMGLAFPSLNQIQGSDFMGSTGCKGVEKIFGFYLSNAVNGDDGEFTLGGYDENKFKGNITWLPVVEKTYWGVSTDGGSFHVGNATGKLNGTYIADTGTSFLILHNDTLAKEVNMAIGAKLDPNDGNNYIDCAVANTGPDFKLTIGGNVFSVAANICTKNCKLF